MNVPIPIALLSFGSACHIRHASQSKTRRYRQVIERPWHGTHPKTIARLKDKVRDLTCRKRRVTFRVVIADLNQFIRGWLPVYGRGLSQHLKRTLNRWIIRRLKAWLLKQWRKPKTRVTNLKRLGLDHEEAMKLGNSRKRIWRISGHYQLNFAMPQKLFTQRYGLVVLR